MSDKAKRPRDYTPHQQKIIQRYYGNIDTIARQRLAELVGELYLAGNKKKAKLWQQTGEVMRKLKVPESRIAHLLKQQNPALVAEVVKEWEAKK